MMDTIEVDHWNLRVSLVNNIWPCVGMYLIVITKKRNVGSLLGHAVWKMVEFEIISYKKTLLHLTEAQVSSSNGHPLTSVWFTFKP